MSKKTKPGFFSQILAIIADRLRKTRPAAARSTDQRRGPAPGEKVSGLPQDEIGSYSSNPLVASMQGVDGRTAQGRIDDYWGSYQNPGPDPYTGDENSGQALPK